MILQNLLHNLILYYTGEMEAVLQMMKHSPFTAITGGATSVVKCAAYFYTTLFVQRTIFAVLFFYDSNILESWIAYHLMCLPIVGPYLNFKYSILDKISGLYHSWFYQIRAARKVQIIGEDGGRRFQKKLWYNAGYDVYAKDEIVLKPQQSKLVDCGFAIEIYPDEMATGVMRSSYNLKGVVVLNAILDPGYTGQVYFIVFNLTQETVVIEKNARYMQVVFTPTSANRRLYQYADTVDAPLYETPRGKKAFGSSGK